MIGRGLDKHLGPSSGVIALAGCQIPTLSPHGPYLGGGGYGPNIDRCIMVKGSIISPFLACQTLTSVVSGLDYLGHRSNGSYPLH